LRAPTPSAAAELVSADQEETLAAIRGTAEMLLTSIKNRIEKIRLLAKPFSAEDLEFRFRSILQPLLIRFDEARGGLLGNLEEKTTGLRQRLDLIKTGIDAANPLSVLERGFSVVYPCRNGEMGPTIRRSSEVKPGETLFIRPMEGLITAITKTSEGDGEK